MQPLKLAPIFDERIWGSDRLIRLFDKPFPADKRIGESWELADLPNACSRISGGSMDGLSLRDLLERHGIEMGFSPEQCEPPFGLLIKFLDANDVLSVQVHPDLQACERLPDAHLKTECWYVVDAEPGAVLYRGLKDGVGPGDLRQAIEEGCVENLLNVVEVSKGDFYFMPAGTVHAIGAGILITEIQTPSDTTYRIFDWNRVDANGQGRQLHIEESLISAHYPDHPPTDISAYSSHSNPAHVALNELAASMGQHRCLVDCPYFSVSHVSFGGGERKLFPIRRPSVMICLSGSGKMSGENDETGGCSFQAGDTLLLSQTHKCQLEIADAGQCLLTCLGPESAS
jgi:mannose-6-phosphate isomerase